MNFLQQTTMAFVLLWHATAAIAQDFTQNPSSIYSGCDERVTSSPEQTAAPVVDQYTQRAFASFSMDEVERGAGDEYGDLCWARMDGVWRAESPVSLDNDKVDESIWGAEGPALLKLANGNYTRPRYLVIVESPQSDQALYLAPGLADQAFVRFESPDGIPMTDVMQRGGAAKVYSATAAFDYGHRLSIRVTRSGRVELDLDGHRYYRPVPNLSPHDAANQDSMMQAFLLSQTLGFLEASRRGYDIATQDPFYLYDNPKQDVFAEPGSDRVYLQDQHVIPANYYYLPDSGQGTIYRKTLISSEQSIQETAAQSFGASVSLEGGGRNLSSDKANLKVSAGFNYAKETSSSMESNQTKARAVGYSRQKKYALVLDHAYTELSDSFIDAVEDARRNFRYQALIDRFGTHYPYAVTYGANARMTMDLDENGYASRIASSSNFSANAGATVYGATGEVNVSEQAGKSTGMKGSMADEKVTFVAVGGNGSWDQAGYSAGEDHYPVLLDLRPISELLNPMNFPGEPEVYVTVRKNLQASIERHLASFPKKDPISVADWTTGIEPAQPAPVEPEEKWYVYVRQIWCGGAGSGRVKTALAGKLEITGKVSGRAPVSTTKTDELETECKYKNARKKFDYTSTSPGLIVLRGTRAQMTGASVTVDLQWFYNSRSKKERNNSRTFTGVFPASMEPGDVKDQIMEVKGVSLPTFHLRVRFKRKQ